MIRSIHNAAPPAAIIVIILINIIVFIVTNVAAAIAAAASYRPRADAAAALGEAFPVSPARGSTITAPPPAAPSQPVDAAPARSRTATAPPATVFVINITSSIVIFLVTNVAIAVAAAACYRPRPWVDAASAAGVGPTASPARG